MVVGCEMDRKSRGTVYVLYVPRAPVDFGQSLRDNLMRDGGQDHPRNEGRLSWQRPMFVDNSDLVMCDAIKSL